MSSYIYLNQSYTDGHYFISNLQAVWNKFSIKILYCKICNISRTLVGNRTVDHSDVVGASPVGAAPTTSSPWVYISVRQGPLSCVSVSQWQRHRQVVAGFALWWRAGWQSRRKTQNTDPEWLVSISEVDALVRKGYQEWSSAFNTLVQIIISTD